MRKGRASRGFTLTELLVVVAVIMILMSLLVVCVDGLYTYAMQLRCQHCMEQIWHACLMYANANGGWLPAAWDFEHERPWHQTLTDAAYIDNAAALACPSSDIATTIGQGSSGVDLPADAGGVELLISEGLRHLKAQQSGGAWDERGIAGETGLAVLAFLGNGIRTDHSEFGDTLKDGIEWLVLRVYSGGGKGIGTFGQRTEDSASNAFNYEQGICTLALADAARVMPNLAFDVGDGQTRTVTQAAQEAFNWLIGKEMSWHGGFVYDSDYAKWGQNRAFLADVSVSGWCWQAIIVAKDAGLDPGQATDEDGNPFTWSELEARAETYLGFLMPTGSRGWYPQTPYRYVTSGRDDVACSGYYAEFNPLQWHCQEPTRRLPPHTERMTAISLSDRLMLGHAPSAQDVVDQLNWLTNNDKHLKLIDGRSPEIYPGALAFTPDLYYIYYTSLALNELRGSLWSDWINTVCEQLRNIQTPGQDYSGIGGSFDNVYVPYPTNFGPYSNLTGTRIYPTALGVMSLEICMADALPGTRWYTHAPGDFSYGYNKLVADQNNRRRKPAADTIILMDYTRSAIGVNDNPMECIAPRHGGKANVLFGDGHVEALTVEDLTEPNTEGEPRIKEHMLSLQPGTEPVPEEEEE